MKITIPSSLFSFVIIIFFLNLAPSFYIVYNKDISNLYGESDPNLYLQAANQLFLYTTLSFLSFLIIYYLTSKRLVFFFYKPIRQLTPKLIYSYSAIRLLTLVTAGIFVLWFFYVIGLPKLLLLGSDFDSWEFRMIGFDDAPRFLQAANEAARRILLPFLLIVEYCKKVILKEKNFNVLFLIFFLYILGIISTLDRAPMLTLFVIIGFIHLSINASVYKFLIFSILSIVILGVIATITTYLQYNITSFDSSIFLPTIKDFFLHRVLLVPSIAAIQLSFEYFPDSSDLLYLKYSRLGALLGFDYIGTEQDLSIYVTPVGYIGDSWRNFGLWGVFFVSGFLGAFSVWIDNKIYLLSWLPSLIISFLFFALILFLVFGVFFSQGALIQIIFLIGIINFFSKCEID